MPNAFTAHKIVCIFFDSAWRFFFVSFVSFVRSLLLFCFSLLFMVCALCRRRIRVYIVCECVSLFGVYFEIVLLLLRLLLLATRAVAAACSCSFISCHCLAFIYIYISKFRMCCFAQATPIICIQRLAATLFPMIFSACIFFCSLDFISFRCLVS